LCAANAVVVFVVLEIVLRTAVSLHLDWSNFRHLSALYLASAVSFFLTDLLGGSLACLALVPLLNFIGGPNTILFAAVAVAVAGVAWGTSRTRRIPACLALALLVLIVANFRGKLIDIVYAKGMKRETPLYAKWNALSRVEVDKWGEAKAIVIDADASTYI